jgi:hypothetical protein
VPNVGVEVEGGKELRKSLKNVEDGLKDLQAAHAAAAGIVAAAAPSYAPLRTGRLAGSIRGSGAKAAATVRAGGAKVPYAGVQEYGWPRRNIPAQPFLVPAAHDTEGEWRPVYEARVEELIDKVHGA